MKTIMQTRSAMNRAGMKHAAMGGMWRQPQQRHVQIASSSSSCISMYNARCGQATHRHRLSHSIRAHATVTLNMLNGETHEIEVESDETILEACLREGIEWSHDCKLGKMREKETVDQGAAMLSDDVIDKGFCLLCVSTPVADAVTIDEITEDELLDVQLG